MESRVKLFGHSVHQMLIVFPLGLLATATIFDVVFWIFGGGGWATASYHMIIAGVIGGLVAAPFGLADYLAIPRGTRARRVGALHGLGNVVVLGLYTASWLIRFGDGSSPATAALLLSIAGAGVATVAGWLGGELVDRLGVGVDDGAGLNAPSSLRSTTP
jgi:uncharacterized membrane protein